MDYLVTDTELSNVANAIRQKGGTSIPLTWDSGFAAAINAIPTGGGSAVINPLSVTANGTYTATGGVDGYSPVTVNVPTGITPTGTKTITENGTYDVTNFASASVALPNGTEVYY